MARLKSQSKGPYKSVKHPNSDHPEAADYIDSIGIDATTVLQDGITDFGYYDRSGPMKRWRTWPSHEIGQKVLDLMYGYHK